MSNPRDILNMLKWRDDRSLEKAEIWYIHRGAPHDTKIISGQDVISLGKSFIQTSTAMIPYHRVTKIIYRKKIIFNRGKP